MADKFQLKALITGVDKLSPMLTGVRKNALQLRKQLRNSELGNIGFADVLQGGALAAPFVMGAQAAMRFETAMADVKKVVKFENPAQFAAMSDDVLDLSERLPMAAEGIAQIVAAGGQSGIAREELAAFAEDAVKMGVAFDQTAEQAGGMMAKWRTAFKMSQGEVVSLADQINYLGNTGPANAQQISKIVTGIGPLGEVAGMAAGEIAAMGATLAGVGIAEDVAATGMKNFMLTLGAGSAATKEQQEAFKALRLDSAEMAKGMQTDAQGTIQRVLLAVSKVSKDKQGAVLTQLFGKESVGAIAPLLTNLELLKSNFDKVSDSAKYAGSMQDEYAARAATTQNNLQLLQNRVVRLGISVGAALLPPFNDFMATIGPVISGVSELAAANPWLVKGILGAAVGFGVLRLSVMASTAALTIMNAVATMSPIGLVVRAIALAAGFLIANWSSVAPYFSALWDRIKGPLMAGWEWFKKVADFSPMALFSSSWQPIVGWFAGLWEQVKAPLMAGWELFKTVAGFSPLGLIVNNWQPIVGWFAGLWEQVKAPLMAGWELFKTVAGFSPLGLIVNNWQPIVGWFAGLWEQVKAPLMAGWELFKTVASFSPLGLVIQNWEPIVAWMKGLWERVKPYVQPIMDAAAWVMGDDGKAASASSPASGPGTTSLAAQAAAVNGANLQGQMVVRFEGAPPGMRVDPAQTNQTGLSVTPQVGYRSLSGG